MRFDYVAVGHVTIDELAADGSRRPGGSAFYSALQAARLGLRALILTRGVPAEVERLLAPYRGELDLEVRPAEHTTTLLTRGSGRARRQRLLAWAGPIEGPIEVDTAILHLAPVARETPREWRGRADFVGLTPQGLVRQWDAAGEIALVPLDRALLPARCDAWVLNERERECCAVPLAHATADGGVVAITDGAAPTELRLPGGERLRVPGRAIPAPAHDLGADDAAASPIETPADDPGAGNVPARPIETPADDLGAGDVFAAALFVALREGQPPAAAADFASAAAALRIAGVGPGAIGDRAAIEAQLGAGV